MNRTVLFQAWASLSDACLYQCSGVGSIDCPDSLPVGAVHGNAARVMNHGIGLSTVSRDSLSNTSPSRQAGTQRKSGGKQVQLCSGGHQPVRPVVWLLPQVTARGMPTESLGLPDTRNYGLPSGGNHHNAPQLEGQIPVHTGMQMRQTPADAFHIRMDCGRKKHGRLRNGSCLRCCVSKPRQCLYW